MTTSTLVLGIELDGEGSHPAAWRRAGHPPAALFDPRRLARLAETAERAGGFLVRHPGRRHQPAGSGS
ncbi:MAG TPA: hypothetical protein VN969_34060 [Streptosporangiaceae bacterium]|nr:hypothetical protein [Streptosporangiaceae bacterium]